MSGETLRTCDVAVLVDEETGEYRGAGRFVPERDAVEDRVLRALRRRYRRVDVVPYAGVAATVARLERLRPRVVFNLTEWVDGERRHDAAIAGLLDLLGLAYTGAGPEGLRLARDKALAKRVVTALGIAAPEGYVAPGPVLRVAPPFPLVVKPQYGDGSDAISGRSIVRDPRALRARVRALVRRTRQPALCEAYVPGRDLYVGLIGNSPRVLPPVELVIGRRQRGAPRLATSRVKHDPRYRARWRVHYRRARLDRATLRRVVAASRLVFHALKLRDYARLDFRLTPDNRLYFIEANPNPDLDPHALNRSGCFAGIRYESLIAGIVESARRRGRGRP